MAYVVSQVIQGRASWAGIFFNSWTAVGCLGGGDGGDGNGEGGRSRDGSRRGHGQERERGRGRRLRTKHNDALFAPFTPYYGESRRRQAARSLVGKQFRPLVVGMAGTGGGDGQRHRRGRMGTGTGTGTGMHAPNEFRNEFTPPLTPHVFRPPDSEQKKLKDTGRYDSIQVRTVEPSASALPQAGGWLTTAPRPTLNPPLILCACALAPLLLLLLLLRLAVLLLLLLLPLLLLLLLGTFPAQGSCSGAAQAAERGRSRQTSKGTRDTMPFN